MTETRRIPTERLLSFFKPRSIVLVGATDNSRWSLYTYDNLKNYAFPGPIYLVNPNHEIVHGQRTLKSLRELPEPVDLAFIMVSTQRVLPLVAEAAEMGIRNFVVLTAGFSEMGAEGARLEHELITFSQKHGLILLGPNGNGYINITDQITPYGLPVAKPITPGPVGVVLQSGALASAVLAFSQAHAIGLSLLVSMGNESMISVTDVVDYLLEDDNTRAIALFLESIRQPEELRRVAEKARACKKPIVVLKIGRSELGSRVALAHTGSLVGDDAVNDAALRQLGIIRVPSLEDLIITAGLAAHTGVLPGPRVGVVTASGGACDILSDLAQDNGIIVPEFAPTTIAGLQEILPSFATAHNPLDVTGYVVVDVTIQRRSLEVVVNDPNIDFVMELVSLDTSREPTPLALANALDQYERRAAVIRASPRPVVLTYTTCLDLPPAGRAVVEHTGLHILAGMEHGMLALGKLLWWSKFVSTPPQTVSEEPLSPVVSDIPRTGNWSEARARTLLQRAGIPIVPGVLATSAEEAVQTARQLGLPVALKIQSPTLLHKSDAGGVALNLASEEAVRAGFTEMWDRIRANQPTAKLEGILVSPMRAAGIELLVGIVRDPLWGPVLTVGLGGIWTEALKDTALRLLPVQRVEIETMLGELRGIALLRGGRGRTPVDLHALSEIISRIGALAYALGPQLAALEINPLVIGSAGIEALDVLVSWQE